MIRAFAIVLDGERLDLVAAQEVSRFSRATPSPAQGSQILILPEAAGVSACSVRSSVISSGGVVAVAGKVARQARKHEGHRASFELVDELRRAPELQW